jgi:phospholipase/carboxylesterase
MTDLGFVPIQQGSDPHSVLMLLHGIGGNEQSVASLAAGADPRPTIISVRAPLIMGPSSFAWYSTSFSANGPLINAREAEQGRRELLRFAEEYRTRNDVQRLYLMGFSQGAIMSVAAALSAPSLVQGAIAFSGRFPAEFEAVVVPRDELSETRIWIGHGTEDATLPIHLGRAMRDSLQRFGAIFDYSEFVAGHQITPEMLSSAHRWLSNQISRNVNSIPFDLVPTSGANL